VAEGLLAAATAVWLGILTSVSPCPLATNVAAISYVGRRVGSPRRVLLAGLLYTLGRAVTYAALGLLIVMSLLSAPQTSHLLQKYMIKILGPLLILVGMVLLDLIRFPVPGPGVSDGLRARGERMGEWGAGFLGMLFALSFCPVSAALFFGSLLPLAVQARSPLIFPSLYGIGTALPVVVFAVVIAAGLGSVGRLFDRVARVEIWVRRATGAVFAGTGIYFCLSEIFQVI
jgi:cytochrome c-type biogenesis protein